MDLTPEQQALLDGSKGEVMAKIVKTLVMYGDAFGAKRMVPVTSKYGHTVISFGLEVMKPVYDLYDTLIAAGLTDGQRFTADPKPLDKNVPHPCWRIYCQKIIVHAEGRYEEQLRKLASRIEIIPVLLSRQVGNKPGKAMLSWAESSAVSMQTLLGARATATRYLELMGSIAGFGRSSSAHRRGTQARGSSRSNASTAGGHSFCSAIA